MRTIFAAALCLLAAGCASPREQAERAIPNPLERFPLKAHAEADETLLAVKPGGGISPTQQAALAQTAERWRDSARPVLVVRAPVGGPQEADAQIMAQQVSGVLAAVGVPPEAIRVEAYDAGPDATAPIIATFPNLVAEVPECGRKWDNLTGTQSNGNQGNFGCAIAANMAAQIANPADILGPRASTPADATRRSVVMDNYRKGVPTGAQADSAGSGSVSKAIP